MLGMKSQAQQHQTIQDFGEQWQWHRDNSGYYGSVALLEDILGPLLSLKTLEGAKVAEIGCGTGRISTMLLEAGASSVTGVEPSAAGEVCLDNLQRWGDRFQLLRTEGQNLPAGRYDLVLSIGVIHHIPDPLPVLRAMRASLRPGGVCLIWVYGKEGNQAYLLVAKILRFFSTKIPHRWLVYFCWGLWVFARLYGTLACRIPFLPLHRYMKQFFMKTTPDKQHLIIYDQLNPTFAKYYRREEAEELLREAGFQAVESNHRHDYSWTVKGTMPATKCS